MERVGGPVIFVIRVFPGPAGAITGTVKRVRTGETVRFGRAQEIADAVARMVARAEQQDPSEDGTGGPA